MFPCAVHSWARSCMNQRLNNRILYNRVGRNRSNYSHICHIYLLLHQVCIDICLRCYTEDFSNQLHHSCKRHNIGHLFGSNSHGSVRNLDHLCLLCSRDNGHRDLWLYRVLYRRNNDLRSRCSYIL